MIMESWNAADQDSGLSLVLLIATYRFPIYCDTLPTISQSFWNAGTEQNLHQAPN